MVSPLISVEELRERLDQVELFDIRWSLTDASFGMSSYQSGHIPGAIFVDLERDLSGGEGPGRHPLPHPADFTTTLGRLGVRPESEVVVYDDMGGAVAARMWWMLRSIGHETARLLDGGWRAWTEAGLPTEIRVKEPRPVRYDQLVQFRGVATREDLAGSYLIDARPRERYRGDVEPVDPKAGHIPGARNYPHAGNLGPDGRFLPGEVLARRYRDVPTEAIVSCGSGVTSCQDALAMVIAGLPMPRVYVGSFSEWSRLGLPVKTGDQP